MTRPDRVAWLLEMAQVTAKRSTCARAHVGAVIARDGRVVSTGYNGAPAGLPHCDHSPRYAAIVPDSGGRIRMDNGGCQVATHAEANAIAFAARYGVATDGSAMYCTTSPCEPCARLILNAGISTVWYMNEYRITSGIELLTRGNVEVNQWSS